MFYTQTDRMFTENAEGREGTRVPLHNVGDTGEGPHEPEEAVSSGSSGIDADGTWGERDVGGPVNFRAAMQDYEDLRKELTTLSKTRTNKTNRSGARRSSTALRKVASGASRRSRITRTTTADTDLEAQGDEKPPSDDEEDFELGGFLKDGHFEKRDESGSAKKVGVIYKHLTVQGVGATTTFVRTLPHAVIGVRIPNSSNGVSDANNTLYRPSDLTFIKSFLTSFLAYQT